MLFSRPLLSLLRVLHFLVHGAPLAPDPCPRARPKAGGREKPYGFKAKVPRGSNRNKSLFEGLWEATCQCQKKVWAEVEMAIWGVLATQAQVP